MDIATLLGLIGAFGIIIAAIATGGSIGLFINVPSILIVIVGSFAVVLMSFTMRQFFGSFKVGLNAFFNKPINPSDLIDVGVELAQIARKEGMVALEQHEVENPFLRKGIMLCVDGHPPELVRKMLNKDINQTIERHEIGRNFFSTLGNIAPAMGMIGTLIGLVQMLSNMDDPKSIGPAMAIALLTTLYGAILANAFAIPIADKLALRSNEERVNRNLILETISAIQEGINPRVLEELLKTFLPESKRTTDEEPR
ncbi:MAG: flagellar motor protein PomA [Gammaproteobacteria bacterium]|nr:flagellar motor protein PomA [Gammaproteobacteria bacterium]